MKPLETKDKPTVSLRAVLREISDEMGDPDIRKRWSAKKQAFIDCFNGDLNKADARMFKALEEAGYSRASFPVTIDAFRECPGIKRALEIKNRLNYVTDDDEEPVIATPEQRKAFWTEMMQDRGLKPLDRLRASELLAKAEGDFKETIEIDQRVQVVQGLFDPEQRRLMLAKLAAGESLSGFDPKELTLKEVEPDSFEAAEASDGEGDSGQPSEDPAPEVNAESDEVSLSPDSEPSEAEEEPETPSEPKKKRPYRKRKLTKRERKFRSLKKNPPNPSSEDA